MPVMAGLHPHSKLTIRCLQKTKLSNNSNSKMYRTKLCYIAHLSHERKILPVQDHLHVRGTLSSFQHRIQHPCDFMPNLLPNKERKINYVITSSQSYTISPSPPPHVAVHGYIYNITINNNTTTLQAAHSEGGSEIRLESL